MSVLINADTSDGLKFTSDTSGEIKLQSAGTDTVTVDSSGNVGIGTSSPADPLEISHATTSRMRFSETTNSLALNIGQWSAKNRIEGSGGSDFIISNYDASNPIAFYTGSGGGNTERMRIDSSGDVGIGTTSPSGRFTVKQTAFGATNTLFDSSHGTTPQGVVIDFSAASPDNNSSTFLTCRDSSTDRLKIFSDGDIDNHDNSYSGFSDVRLKEQITDSGSQWEDIKNLRVRKFKFKQDVSEKGDSDDLLRIGVIAQELESSGMGGLVSTKPEILWTDEDELPVDEDGNPTVSVGDVKSEEIKSVKYSILYMKAVKALQEAITKIEDLETRIEALENA